MSLFEKNNKNAKKLCLITIQPLVNPPLVCNKLEKKISLVFHIIVVEFCLYKDWIFFILNDSILVLLECWGSLFQATIYHALLD